MIIRQAVEADIPAVVEIFRKCTDLMKQNGIEQWNYTYPLNSHVTLDVTRTSAYVMEAEGVVVATVTLDQNQDTQYAGIHWHTYDKSPFVIHRLAVLPEYQCRGIASELCEFAEKLAREKGCRSIRLDAYSLNPASNYLYTKLGYRRTGGFCYFHGNAVPFYCYDKIIR